MTQPIAGRMFHRALRACMSEGRAPTQEEIEQLAERIWIEAFAVQAGADWDDVPAYSTIRQRVISAARGALSATPRPSVTMA